MSHHHILAVVGWRDAIANSVFDDYTLALEKYASLSNTLFADNEIMEPGGLTIERAAEASGYGDGHVAAIGGDAIALLLTTCLDDEAECHWFSPSWN